jgi:hypothetical protein
MGERAEDIYYQEGLECSMDDGCIDSAEHGFMAGYLADWKPDERRIYI